MATSHFFAYLSRMKFIRRWGLMHSTYPENIQEHSLRVAQIAHALAIIRNRLFGGDVSPERTATLALYHDTSEDRKSTRLNSSHLVISYAVFCLKKKKKIPLPLVKPQTTSLV